MSGAPADPRPKAGAGDKSSYVPGGAAPASGGGAAGSPRTCNGSRCAAEVPLAPAPHAWHCGVCGFGGWGAEVTHAPALCPLSSGDCRDRGGWGADAATRVGVGSCVWPSARHPAQSRLV
eukprot:scaffold15215_cov103-Isochrysis_galbana.AAC.5